jgi:hypothetical protein
MDYGRLGRWNSGGGLEADQIGFTRTWTHRRPSELAASVLKMMCW